MTKEPKKNRINFTSQQKNEFAKLIVEEGYTTKQVMDISGACQTAVLRWKRQYISKKEGQVIDGKIPLDDDKREFIVLKNNLLKLMRI